MADEYDYDRDGEPREDRPRRRREVRGGDRFERYDGEPVKQVSALGIFALVQGIISLVVSLIPCIGAFGIIGGVIGLALGLLALLFAKNSEGQVGIGMPVAAISVNLGGIMIAGIWIVLLAGALDKKPNPPDGDQTDGAPAAGPGDPGNPALTIAAADLDREYGDNEPAADVKYKGKWIEVTGKVARVTGDTHPRKMTLELDADTTVDCVFGMDKKGDLATLKINEGVTVRGRCRGKVDGSVTLEDCVRTAREPEKAVEAPAGKVTKVTTDELYKAFDENVIAADGAYKDKVLEVSGKVNKVLRINQGKTTLVLRSGDEEGAAVVYCEFLVKDAPQLAALKNGQAVVVRGKCVGQPGGFGVVTLERCSVVK